MGRRWAESSTPFSRNGDRQTTIVALGGGVVGDIAPASPRRAGHTRRRLASSFRDDTARASRLVGRREDGRPINIPGSRQEHDRGLSPAAARRGGHRRSADATATRADRRLGRSDQVRSRFSMNPSWSWIEANLARLLALDGDALVHAGASIVRDHAEVVASDERESGRRALLNFGLHRSPMPLESGMGYGHWSHWRGSGVR